MSKLVEAAAEFLSRDTSTKRIQESELEEAVHVIHPKTNGPVHITDVKNARDFNSRWNKESNKHRAEFGHDSPIASKSSPDFKGKTAQKMKYSEYVKLVGG